MRKGKTGGGSRKEQRRNGVRTGLSGEESGVGSSGRSGADALELVLVDGGAFLGSSRLGSGERLELGLSLEITLDLFGVAVLWEAREISTAPVEKTGKEHSRRTCQP